MPRPISAEKKQAMLTENIRTLLPRMAVPTIIAQLITTIYNLVDTYFVSTLGTNATAAVGVNSSLEHSITIIGTLIGAGACSYIARLLGAGKKDTADRVLSTCFFTGAALGLLFILIGKTFMNQMILLLGATADCMEYSVQYATYVLYAAPFMIVSFILNMCLRSEGSATYSMIGIGFGGILNCILDPIFIYSLGLGVAGASMATAISKTISCIILVAPYVRKRTSCTLSIRKFKFDWEDTKDVVSIGSTSFFRSALALVANIIVNRIAGGFSTSVLAALSVANRIMQFPFAIILGFGQGYQPVVGFNWGAKQMKRVRECFSFASAISIVGGIVMGAILAACANPIVHVFNSSADAEVLRVGIICIRLQCATLVVHAWVSIINMFYAGIGRAKEAILMSTARQGYCFWPVILILPRIIGTMGIAATQAIADLLSIIPAIPLAIKAVKLIDAKEQELTKK